MATAKKEAKTDVAAQMDKLERLITKVQQAQKEFASFSQEQVDRIFFEAAMAANHERISLAKEAVEETGMGIVEDKVIKNHFASEMVYNKFRTLKTCNEIDRDESAGIVKVAEPLGVLAGVIPTTNPTSTAIFKSLIALKTRNGIIFSPHPRAKKCTVRAAKIVLEAAVKAGAPRDIIAWIEEPSIEGSNYLMQHSSIAAILATGGPGMVRAAYSSGKPALGVGAGNTPVVIDETADIKMAVSSILMSKTFDNGVICASEQAVIAEKSVYNSVRQEFLTQGAYVLNADERKKVGQTLFKDNRINAEVVGQSAAKIARLAGITVPEETKVLIAEVEKTESAEVFAHEKLSPVLAMYSATDYTDAFEKAHRLIELGGLGHTSVLYTSDKNSMRINQYGSLMKTGRTLINTPASHGAIGDIYNFNLAPSLTLGCGSWGGNSISDNVGPKHLINVKTVAIRKENMLWFQVPNKVYFKRGALGVALEDLAEKKKAFVVTDRFLHENGYCESLLKKLRRLDITYEVYSDVAPDPTLATAMDGASKLKAFDADLIIAIGGGSPMDAAKIMWLLYEHPEIDFKDLAMRFMDIRKRVYKFPKLGGKAEFVAIPTTSGTGSEVTPFAVITDEKTGQKYPIADYELTPNMAIVDADLAKDMPASLTAFSGIDALTHALEAYVSTLATEFTSPLALEAIRLLFEYLPRSYKNGGEDMEAREKVHHASNMAGMAFANAFLGICHSMAHKMGAKFHLPHGLANALLINDVIRFNATDAPRKMGTFSQYKNPEAKARYARIARYIGLSGADDAALVEALIGKITELKQQLDIPLTIKEAKVDRDAFYAALETLSEDAFDDQCTGANPRYPLMSELRDIYSAAYEGVK
ncbi:bifunctional acetaldehyde-CoA/alcohol dehydrogenase [Chitinivibrio alkaliphilus]|uniref:Aldehyde-alcohol dehydrogenase n=1 Tax=Chitinivibrio alkaliphilus ACht1 TaxID=1313304 RepID=U7D995_9BACT|nr:bifunctional acetaldehyde-CoA/alcohol dehydrogenase [Chitinivibrio alkaliphilus]ERP30975.1 bifunctional acetaldehyde-CoA/alcohol dehydrogenase [Chitinivibrio alkaliphilus ACht1]